MSEIKVGDWVEVLEVDDIDVHKGIEVGDVYEVVRVKPTGKVGVAVRRNGRDSDILFPSQIKKVDSPKASDYEEGERPASNHYQNTNGNDVWQFMDDNLSTERVKGFHQGNALKYITRYSVKHDEPEKRIEDLRKAKVYIDKLIELEQMK